MTQIKMPMGGSVRKLRRSRKAFESYVKGIHDDQMTPVRVEYEKEREFQVLVFLLSMESKGLVPEKVLVAMREKRLGRETAYHDQLMCEYAQRGGVRWPSLEETRVKMGVRLKTPAEIRAELDEYARQNGPVSAADFKLFVRNKRAEEVTR